MIINVRNTKDYLVTIEDLDITLVANETKDLLEYKLLADISASESIISLIADGSIIVNNGEKDLNKNEGLKYIAFHNTLVEPRDRSGKLRVHQTSRKFGTVICWTGEGDDPSDPSSIGGGEPISFQYKVGNNDPLTKYIDFNMVENETWLHEGYVTWKDGDLDTLDLQMVTRAVSWQPGTGTNYNLYGGYLIVPAAPGTGTVELTGDITEATGGLVYMPPGDLGERSAAFWDAEWDTTTKKFTNITPAPTGNGHYNLFAGEIVVAHFLRKMPLLDSGFIALNSSDTDEIGQGMRLKVIADTNTSNSDHDWSVACTMCLHRAKTV